MQQYKEKLKLENRVLIFAIVVMAAFALVSLLATLDILDLTPIAGDDRWQTAWRSFLWALSFNITLILIQRLYKNRKALKDEKQLKALYVTKNDERSAQVINCARSTALSVFYILNPIAMVIAGYFSVAVSITLFACSALLSFLSLGLTFYFGKKY